MTNFPMGEANFHKTPGGPIVYRDIEPIGLDDPNLELDGLVPDPYDPRLRLSSPFHEVQYLGSDHPSEAPVDFLYVAGDLDSFYSPAGLGIWADRERTYRRGVSWHAATAQARNEGFNERQIGYHTELAHKLEPEAGRLSIILAYGNPNVGMADLYYYMTKES